MSNRRKGKIYEERAKKILEENSIKILEMNYFGSFGEIDIIGIQNETIIFFEVKYRKNTAYGLPIEAINHKKIKKIYSTAKEYLLKKKIQNKNIRFDAITFLGEDKMEWMKNILWGDEIGV